MSEDEVKHMRWGGIGLAVSIVGTVVLLLAGGTEGGAVAMVGGVAVLVGALVVVAAFLASVFPSWFVPQPDGPIDGDRATALDQRTAKLCAQCPTIYSHDRDRCPTCDASSFVQAATVYGVSEAIDAARATVATSSLPWLKQRAEERIDEELAAKGRKPRLVQFDVSGKPPKSWGELGSVDALAVVRGASVILVAAAVSLSSAIFLKSRSDYRRPELDAQHRLQRLGLAATTPPSPDARAYLWQAPDGRTWACEVVQEARP